MSKVRDIATEIITERVRQRAEGYVKREASDYDDDYDQGELAGAAATLAAPYPIFYRETDQTDAYETVHVFRPCWPWACKYGLDTDDRRERLVRAAALIVAEIERLDRATGRA